MEHQWLQAVGFYCYRGDQGEKSEYSSLENEYTLADGETGPCCRWEMLLCYKHTSTLDPLVMEDYGFGFICSLYYRNDAINLNPKGSTRTKTVKLYSFNVL